MELFRPVLLEKLLFLLRGKLDVSGFVVVPLAIELAAARALLYLAIMSSVL
jgi:hypothetical protein